MFDLSYSDFMKVDIRVGTILEAEENNKLRQPSIILKIDFGEQIGIKKSSAKLKANYKVNDLINKQVAAVINFPPKQIGSFMSECLITGFYNSDNNPNTKFIRYFDENRFQRYLVKIFLFLCCLF